MVHLYIPSYNRPMQLYALLESIKLHDKANLFSKIEIAYEATTDKIAVGYNKLILQCSLWDDHIIFRPKSGSHYKDIMRSVDGAGEYWAISTDDSVFYRDFQIDQPLDELFTNDVFCFSFRLGYNTKIIDYSNPNSELNLLSGTELDGDIVKFYWPNHSGHFSHIFALDSTLLQTELLKTLIIRSCSPAHFSYRHFESKMMDYLRMNPNKPFALCHKQSSLVNSPTNLVTTGPYVKNGVKYGFSVEELNDRWLCGMKLDISKIDTGSINSVQQEIPWTFIQDE